MMIQLFEIKGQPFFPPRNRKNSSQPLSPVLSLSSLASHLQMAFYFCGEGGEGWREREKSNGKNFLTYPFSVRKEIRILLMPQLHLN